MITFNSIIESSTLKMFQPKYIPTTPFSIESWTKLKNSRKVFILGHLAINVGYFDYFHDLFNDTISPMYKTKI